MTRAIAMVAVLVLAGCGKIGITGAIDQAVGNWAELRLPAGCVAKQISVEHDSGVAVLCEDGRVFH